MMDYEEWEVDDHTVVPQTTVMYSDKVRDQEVQGRPYGIEYKNPPSSEVTDLLHLFKSGQIQIIKTDIYQKDSRDDGNDEDFDINS